MFCRMRSLGGFVPASSHAPPGGGHRRAAHHPLPFLHRSPSGSQLRPATLPLKSLPDRLAPRRPAHPPRCSQVWLPFRPPRQLRKPASARAHRGRGLDERGAEEEPLLSLQGVRSRHQTGGDSSWQTHSLVPKCSRHHQRHSPAQRAPPFPPPLPANAPRSGCLSHSVHLPLCFYFHAAAPNLLVTYACPSCHFSGHVLRGPVTLS